MTFDEILDQAIAAGQRALALATASGEVVLQALAHPESLLVASWGIGLLSLRQGDLHRVLPRLERAVSICAHCQRGLGMLYAATGQRELARTALSAAIALYRAMEMTFWLPQAEAALAQVEGQY